MVDQESKTRSPGEEAVKKAKEEDEKKGGGEVVCEEPTI